MATSYSALACGLGQGNNLRNIKIGFIGAGNMANGLIRGLIFNGARSENIWASDLDDNKLQTLEQECGIQTGSNSDIVNKANVIVLAVKPQVMMDVCSALAADLGDKEALLLSIGMSNDFEAAIAEGSTLIRIGTTIFGPRS